MINDYLSLRCTAGHKTENGYRNVGGAVGVPLSEGTPLPRPLWVLAASGSQLPPCPERWCWLLCEPLTYRYLGGYALPAEAAKDSLMGGGQRPGPWPWGRTSLWGWLLPRISSLHGEARARLLLKAAPPSPFLTPQVPWLPSPEYSLAINHLPGVPV